MERVKESKREKELTVYVSSSFVKLHNPTVCSACVLTEKHFRHWATAARQISKSKREKYFAEGHNHLVAARTVRENGFTASPPSPLFIFAFVYCLTFFGELANLLKKGVRPNTSYFRPFVVSLPLITVESYCNRFFF